MSPRHIRACARLRAKIVIGILLTIALLPIVDATTSASTLPATAPPVRVSGNRLVDSAGHPIHLRGVNRMSFEYTCAQDRGTFEGPTDLAAVSAITSWGSNVVRIPLNEHCWLGVDDGAATPEYIGEPYRQAVQSFVDLLVANGVYVILDLHWSAPAGAAADRQRPMPNTSYSALFWYSVAERFRGNDAVIFDLFNAPVPNNNANDDNDDAARRSWECWRDGGTASCDETLSLGPPETAMSASQTVGMQALVDAVRTTGATNVILIGGIQWANTLWSSATHNWLSNRPTDPLGNLAASVQMYSTSWCTTVACYDSDIAPVAAQVPLVAAEFGTGGCDASAAQWLNTLASWLDGHQAGYLGWVWSVPGGCDNGHLIASWDGAPSQYGQIYRDHLAAVSPSPTPPPDPTPTPVPSPTSTPDPTPSPTPTLSPNPSPSPTATPTPTPAPPLAALSVRGNQLTNASGEPVILRGVNRMSFEYACAQDWGIVDGPIDQAAVSAITSWGSNVVRIPLNEHCWLGVDDGAPTPEYIGEPYRQAVVGLVDLLIANGVYVILDPHWSAPAGAPADGQKPMPNTSYSVAFWQSVANTFRGRDQVIFDVFNEPVPNNNAADDSDEAARRSWECWRDGGTASCDETLSLGPPETNMSASQTVGMQALVDAVRGTGATNVILVGGIQWANTLWSSAAHNWLTYRPTDPLGNIAAAVHVYSTAWCAAITCYDSEIAPIAAQAPVIVGEFGISGCDAAAAEWIGTLLGWLDAHQTGYVAFVWAAPDGCTNGNLIADWAGTPSQYGQIYKAHLDGLR